jgi:hypothetical protein
MTTKKDNSLDGFFAAIRDSVDNHAKRKNYTDNDPDGQNKLAESMKMLGLHIPHCLGEIIYKVAEYHKTPRRVLMEKVAGWAWLVWRETDE